ncbi:galectin-1-like [Acipenser oxyrinchus oxyrinchus]|uniref:Galectin n=1 Tax=Acipenser oxyrinchus oxyrinchus TaxID=40147 RepID=A0AAD8CGV2_ACIOX|nr:galectin-1-like [Acipenser oxyrinchus oxyrinchus]
MHSCIFVFSPSISFNLGKSEEELALHFDIRFNYSDVKTVVMNSWVDGKFGDEVKSKDFPYEYGQLTKIAIHYYKDRFQIHVPDGYVYDFPNRCPDWKLSFLEVIGGFKTISFSIQ